LPGATTASEERVVQEQDETLWRIRRQKGPSPSPSVTKTVLTVLRGPSFGELVQVARLEDMAAIQSNPDMLVSTEWRFFLADNGTFRAEQTQSEQLDQPHAAAKRTVRKTLFRWDGQELVRVEP
jgi:hypothetical protein